MQISYNEAKNGYEVTLSAEEKDACATVLENYGFKWSAQKNLYWAWTNAQSNSFIQMVTLFKGADMVLPEKLKLSSYIRDFFSRGNYNFEDIALLSGVTVEEVKLKTIEMYSDAELQRMGLYEKIIDHEVEYAVMSCVSMFPSTENKAIKYCLREQRIFVSDSCIEAIRKKNSSTVPHRNKAVQKEGPVENIPKEEKVKIQPLEKQAYKKR